jgi:putative SOS response-associated peptidase YedK
MCGRYTLKTPVERLSEQFQFPQIIPIKPRYNIAPSQQVAVVRRVPDDNERKLALLRWGLIPAWTKDPSKARRPINAKAETVDKLPSFRVAFRQRRCLIPADGFYEWKQEGGRKQPVYICMKDRAPFAFAGLWEQWEAQDGQVIESCTLLTTEPNELLKPIHNRMPVILVPKDYDLWLDPDMREVSRLKPLLHPYPPEQMVYYPVNLRVNNPRHDDPLCTEPLPEKRNSLFCPPALD